MSYSGPVTNPHTSATYNTWDDVAKDMDSHPWCRVKIAAFAKRLGITPETIMSKEEWMDVIHWLCGEWGTINAQEFIGKMDSMSDDELRAWLERARKRKKILENYLSSSKAVEMVASYIS